MSISNPERGGISDLAANTLEGARAQFHRHEGVFRESAFEKKGLPAGKTKAWIVVGMPDDYDDPLTLLAQQIQAMMDQSSTDAPALMLG